MQDHVADVLVEREALSQRTPAGLVISVAAHAAAFFFLIFSPHREPTTVERPRVITMRLAPAGGQPPAKSPSRPAPARPAAATVAQPVAKPVVELPVPAAPIANVQPPPSKPAKTDPARTGEKSVFGSAGKPAPASTPAPAVAAPAAGGSQGIGTQSASGSGTFAVPGVGSAGVTGLEGGDFPYDVYIDRMTTRIGGNWFRPGSAGDMITRVHFIIERDGRIRDAKIEESSGNRTFDRAALRAVIESSPLPPLPGQYSGRYLGVYLTFH